MSQTEIKTYQITINKKLRQTDDPILLGRQILNLEGLDVISNIVFQLGPDHIMEHLRNDETTDLRVSGVEEFFTFETDRIFRFMLNGVDMQWGANKINVPTLLHLSGEDPDEFEIWQEQGSGPDKQISETEFINLGKQGVEIFKTKKATVTVLYNHQPVEIKKGKYTTEQLNGIFNVPAGYILELVVEGEFIELKPGRTIKIKKGMEFLSHAPKGSSS